MRAAIDAPCLVCVSIGKGKQVSASPSSSPLGRASHFYFASAVAQWAISTADKTPPIDGLIFYCLEGKKKTQPSRVTAANCGSHPAWQGHGSHRKTREQFYGDRLSVVPPAPHCSLIRHNRFVLPQSAPTEPMTGNRMLLPDHTYGSLPVCTGTPQLVSISSWERAR